MSLETSEDSTECYSGSVLDAEASFCWERIAVVNSSVLLLEAPGERDSTPLAGVCAPLKSGLLPSPRLQHTKLRGEQTHPRLSALGPAALGPTALCQHTAVTMGYSACVCHVPALALGVC